MSMSSMNRSGRGDSDVGFMFEDRLAAVPRAPGVYIMRGKSDVVLYVGKSVSLRSRLRSYFGSSKNLTGKTRELMRRVEDFYYIVADAEREALLLENSLIK